MTSDAKIARKRNILVGNGQACFIKRIPGSLCHHASLPVKRGFNLFIIPAVTV
jgi:hypothetical protein